MPCGGCAARRAGRIASTKYVWQSEDGMTTKTYDTELQAKAKVSRAGGTYKPVDQ